MKHLVRPSIGLLGRIVAILLLTVLVEFGASTFLYERASEVSVRDDEARRLAEHLVVARRLIAESPPARRAAMATELTTDHYSVGWQPGAPPGAASTTPTRRQIIAWEPTLAGADLRAAIREQGSKTAITGGLRLPDGSWMSFEAQQPARKIDPIFRRILLALIPAIALIALGGLMVRHTLGPMKRLAEAADRAGDTRQPPVPEAGPVEVRHVIAAFNRMQARLHKLIADRTQALAAVGHDLRTPLARLRLRADGIDDLDARRTVQSDIAEMEAMIASLMAFLGGEEPPEQPTLIDVAVLCATLADEAADMGREASYTGPDHIECQVHPYSFKRALSNLVDNALKYGDQVTISAERTADRVVVRVEDDGPGIPPEAIDAALEPFVRLDTARGRDTSGFGLGLAIVAAAVELEKGTLTLANREPHGLCAEVSLPCA